MGRPTPTPTHSNKHHKPHRDPDSETPNDDPTVSREQNRTCRAPARKRHARCDTAHRGATGRRSERSGRSAGVRFKPRPRATQQTAVLARLYQVRSRRPASPHCITELQKRPRRRHRFMASPTQKASHLRITCVARKDSFSILKARPAQNQPLRLNSFRRSHTHAACTTVEHPRHRRKRPRHTTNVAMFALGHRDRRAGRRSRPADTTTPRR